tara:strand:+ start:727 stop:1767 length:1041 start_codon:yes stop_codon:yes gene_type:complete
MHNLKHSENNDQKLENVRLLFDSILQGQRIKLGAVKNGEKWYSTNCPLPGHEDKKPSFNFNYSGGWTCFTCNKKGDAVHLAKELNLDPTPYYNSVLKKTGVDALPRFDDKPKLKLAHKKTYKYFEDYEYFKKTLSKDLYNNNNLALFYANKFGSIASLKLLENYLIGTDSDGATIFWYADINNNICHSKTMQYDSSGHRSGKITTDYYGIATENIKKPLYGEWIARKNKKAIGIVEAEKTASAMSVYDESKLWLATGGLSKLDQDSLEVYNRELNFYPDIDAYNKWRIQVESMDLNTQIYDISKLWTLNELEPPHEKADPVDYFFEHVEVRQDPDWSQDEYDSIFG